MSSVIKRINDSLLTEVDENLQMNLLNTIKVPKNLHYLTDRLPKPNYEPLKTKRVDKRKFLQTLAGYTDIPDREEIPSPEQMKQMVLPKIPQQRKHHHTNNNNNHKIHRNEDVDERISEVSQILYDDQQSQISQPKVHPRSLSKKHLKQYDHQKHDKYGIASPPNYPESLKSEIHSTKHANPIDILQLKQQYELSKDKITQHIYVPQKKKKDLSPIRQKKYNGPNILDIEGESKPLLIKSRKNQSIDQSIIYEDKLPKNNGLKLPKIGNSNSNNNIVGSILGLGIVGNAARSIEKENTKIKEIQKVYKSNIDPINDIKDRYRQLKKNDRNKLQQIKNSSLPQSNHNPSSEKYQYIYTQGQDLDD